MTSKERREYCDTFLTQAFNAGILWANKTLQPLDDILRKKDISRWCSLMGWRPEMIKSLAERGKIKEHTLTSSANAARYYSKAEITVALLKENIITGFAGRFPELSLI